MPERIVALRDANGTEYRIVISDGRVTVNEIELRAEQIDSATVWLRPVESRDGRQGGTRQTLAYAVASGGVHWVFLDGEVYRFDADHVAGRRKRSASAAGS